jgi:hypothetical protein
MTERWNTIAAASSITSVEANMVRKEHLMDLPKRFILTYGDPGTGSHNSGGAEKMAAETHKKEIIANQFPRAPKFEKGDLVETYYIKDVPALVQRLNTSNVVYWAYFGHSGPWEGGPKYDKWESDVNAISVQWENNRDLIIEKSAQIDSTAGSLSSLRKNGIKAPHLELQLAGLKAELVKLNNEKLKLESKLRALEEQFKLTQNDIAWYSGPGALYIAQGALPKGNLTSRGYIQDAPATDLPKAAFRPDAQVRLFGCRGAWAPNPIGKQIKDHLNIPVFAFANSGGSIYTHDQRLGHGKRATTAADRNAKILPNKPTWMVPINGTPVFTQL